MLKKLIALQFKKPSGLFGIFSSNIMIRGNMSSYHKLIENLEIKPNEKVLEIGYGQGIGISLMAEMYPSNIIHGVDFSRLMYKRATKRNKKYIDEKKVKLIYGNFLATNLNDNDYDKIFCINVVYFWDQLQPPFRKIWSVLKNGGSFHMFMAKREMLIEKKAPDEVFNKYSIEQIVEALKISGFGEVNYDFDKGYYVKAKK